MSSSLSRRAVLAGGTAMALAGSAVTLAGCSGPADAPESPTTRAEPPEHALARQLMADKERTIGLYSVLIAKDGATLTPFRDRHQAHLTELRRRFPGVTPAPGGPATPSSGSPPAAGSPSGSPPPTAGSPQSAAPSPGSSHRAATAPVSLSRLRDLERRSAALRARQVAGVSPAFAQLIASIGACEAAHAVALPRSL
ncbi:hypothetical protein AB0C18_06985 [Nonomuraea muscovyensis]|uniref:hypothetical protein n=1 Tax=Nonomuraea muscovyensis TaxID=1124761 RepID=UPI0033E2C627